jgi:hypothetical protein
MKHRRLSRVEVAGTPYLLWNAFVNLIALEPLDELDEIQRPAALVFSYESEVQNGGHLQYFENCGSDLLQKTIDALSKLGARKQRHLLESAGRLWCSRMRAPIRTTEGYVVTALEDEFQRHDSEFHKCTPTLQACLEEYLNPQVSG